MKNLILPAVLFMAILSAASCGGSLPRADKSTMERYEKACDKVFDDVWRGPGNVLHSLMVVDEGKVVYERWNVGFSPDQLQVMWSVSKTFTAFAIGFAQQDGLLSTSDKVVSFFDEDMLPENPHPWLEDLTIHDLLIMSSGLPDLTYDVLDNKVDDWGRSFLNSDFIFEPGHQFNYNSMNGYILSMIISKVTGQTMEDYLDEKLFAPLKIRDYHSLKSPQGFDAGGWGLYLSTESLAKAGQFFLQKGNWNGKQLLAQEWFDTASYPHIMQYTNLIEDPAVLENIKDDQGFQGYGYQMWNCTDGAVRMHGANGQLAIIFPQQNAVVVTTAFSSDEQKLLDSIWKNIYPLL